MSGFTSEKCVEHGLDKKEQYRGKYITIHDNRGICSHAGFCTSLLPEVFHGGEPWIDPDTVKLVRNIQGHTVILTKAGGIFGAVEGICTHQGGPLYDGVIENDLIRCPWHGHGFHSVTGKAQHHEENLEAFKTALDFKGPSLVEIISDSELI